MIARRIIAARQQIVLPWWRAGGVAESDVLAVYKPKGAASSAAALVNVANPGTYNAASKGGNSPTWNATDGWVFVRASSQGLRTGFVSTDLTATPSILVRYSGIVDTTGNYLSGITRSASPIAYRLHIVARTALVSVLAGDTAGGITNNGSYLSGVLGIKITATTQEGWLNGTAYGNSATNYNSTIGNYLGIGCSYDVTSSTYTNYINGKIQAMVYLKAATTEQIAAISTAMAAL